MNTQTFKQYQEFYKDHLLNDCMKFWMNSDLLDHENGGYITSVDRFGKSYNNDKSVWFQGRGLWTFSALTRLYGEREEWTKAALLGKKFLEEHCVDEDGRMFFQTMQDGTPLRKRRYMYSESFYVAGMAEYGAAFNDKDALDKAEKCFGLMMKMYEDPTSDPFKITPKVLNRADRAAAVPMVLVSSAQILRRCIPEKAEHYTKITKQIANDIFKYFYKPEMKCSLETVGMNGEFIDNPAGRTINPGHAMENAWFLMNEALYSGDDEIITKAKNIFDWSLELGWDKEHGGVSYYKDILGRPCEQLEHDMKLWWVHNEAAIALLMLYGITKEQKYWDWFVKFHDFTMKHFHDKEHGEWYGYLHNDNTVSHTQKGSMWKGPFHLPRALMIIEQLLGQLAETGEIKDIL